MQETVVRLKSNIDACDRNIARIRASISDQEVKLKDKGFTNERILEKTRLLRQDLRLIEKKKASYEQAKEQAEADLYHTDEMRAQTKRKRSPKRKMDDVMGEPPVYARNAHARRVSSYHQRRGSHRETHLLRDPGERHAILNTLQSEIAHLKHNMVFSEKQNSRLLLKQQHEISKLKRASVSMGSEHMAGTGMQERMLERNVLITKLKDKLAGSEQKIDRWKQQYKESIFERDKLENELDSLEEKVRDKDMLIKELSAKIVQLETELTENDIGGGHDPEIYGLELELLKAQLNEKEDESAMLKEQMEELLSKGMSDDERNQELGRMRSESRVDTERLKEKLSLANDNVEDLREQNDRLRSETNHLKRQKKDTETEHSQEIERLRSQIASYREVEDDAQEHESKLRERLQNLEAERDTLLENFRIAKKDLIFLKEENEQLLNNNSRKLEHIEALHSTIDTVADTSEGITKQQISFVQTQLAELSGAYRAKCEEVLDQDKLIRSANKELKQVDLEFQECQDRLQATHAQQEQDVENIILLQQQNVEVRTTIGNMVEKISLYELLCTKLNRQMTEFEHILKSSNDQVKKALKPIVVFQREICRIAQDLETMDCTSTDIGEVMAKWDQEFPAAMDPTLTHRAPPPRQQRRNRSTPNLIKRSPRRRQRRMISSSSSSQSTMAQSHQLRVGDSRFRNKVRVH